MSKKRNVRQGDCLSVLKKMTANSVDSVVTDPPAGISFMGKEWDSDKGGRTEWVAWMTSVMRECLRVLKPGGHALVWAIPRTSHWTATALEDAGFEIRDVVTHLFGQGFPKSLDISKAMDKAAGAEREVVGVGKRHGGGKDIKGGRYGSTEGADDAHGAGLITAPATDEAKQWSGWGTALKPASEHWILVRRPISEKNIAANVQRWGVGGINIDGCRIEGAKPATTRGAGGQNGKYNALPARGRILDDGMGRFPANLVLSHSPHCEDSQCDIECAVARLDAQSGTLKTGNHTGKRASVGYHGGSGTEAGAFVRPANEGGASRFFYVAKVSPSERGDENKHPTVKPVKLMRYLIRLITPPGGLVLDPFAGSGTTGVAAMLEGMEFIGIERELEYAAIAEKRISSTAEAVLV